MRKLLSAALLLLVLALPARADVYAGPTDFTAPGTLVLGTTNGGTVVVTAAGAPTTPVFTIQGSSDPASVTLAASTWTNLPAVPVAGGAAVSSMSSTGKWAVNTAGMTRVRMNLTALAAGDLLVTMDGGPAAGVVALGYSSTNPLPVGSGTVSITQTVVTLTAATSRTLIAANPSRKYLFWMNIGTAPMTVAPGAVTVTAGQGANFDPGSSSSNQGGTFSMENSSISQQSFSAISTAGTTVVVWEGQ